MISTPFSRPLIVLAALATSTTLLAGASTEAFAASPGYRFVPEAPAKSSTVVVRDTMWRCNDQGCVAATATSRPEIVCASAARKLGKAVSFVANGTEFDTDKLAKCNARAM